MLTGTHLLQSCGIVLCEIETAEHQERLFEINFKCFNTLKPAPTPPKHIRAHTHTHYANMSFHLRRAYLQLHVSPFLISPFVCPSSPFLPPLSFSLTCFCPPCLSSVSLLLQLPEHCWYPVGLLSITSRLDSRRPALASPTAGLPRVVPPPLQRHIKHQ